MFMLTAAVFSVEPYPRCKSLPNNLRKSESNSGECEAAPEIKYFKLLRPAFFSMSGRSKGTKWLYFQPENFSLTLVTIVSQPFGTLTNISGLTLGKSYFRSNLWE